MARAERFQVEAQLSLGVLSQFAGDQAATLLLIVQALKRNRLISAAESRRLISLLDSDLPEAHRRVTAELFAQARRRLQTDIIIRSC
jgi:hypothetical protein